MKPTKAQSFAIELLIIFICHNKTKMLASKGKPAYTEGIQKRDVAVTTSPIADPQSGDAPLLIYTEITISSTLSGDGYFLLLKLMSATTKDNNITIKIAKLITSCRASVTRITQALPFQKCEAYSFNTICITSFF